VESSDVDKYCIYGVERHSCKDYGGLGDEEASMSALYGSKFSGGDRRWMVTYGKGLEWPAISDCTSHIGPTRFLHLVQSLCVSATAVSLLAARCGIVVGFSENKY